MRRSQIIQSSVSFGFVKFWFGFGFTLSGLGQFGFYTIRSQSVSVLHYPVLVGFEIF